jgi:hypothetical protein
MHVRMGVVVVYKSTYPHVHTSVVLALPLFSLYIDIFEINTFINNNHGLH